MALYLDASVMLPTLVAEATSSTVLGFLAAATDELLVSDYAAAEVASALSRLVRMGRLSTDAGRNRLARFDSWRNADTSPIALDNTDVQAAAVLVRRFELKLRTPDALHLAVSVRLGARLVTYDGTLADAAAACGTPAIRP
ncbi:MAG: type II toxin-antitoxin system VapC family toxin [Caulobacteraceae bacterium]